MYNYNWAEIPNKKQWLKLLRRKTIKGIYGSMRNSHLVTNLKKLKNKKHEPAN